MGSYQKEFKKIDEKGVQTRIQQYIDESLIFDPYHNTELLQGKQLKGRRRARIGNHRITFVICEECRKNQWREIFQCSDCKDKPNRFIRLIQVGHRGNVYG